MTAPLLCALLLSSSTVFAQDPGEGFDASLSAWREAHGADWRVVVDGETGFGRFLYGATAEGGGAPADREGWALLAEAYLGAAEALTGIEPQTLRVDDVTHLPLARAGSTDKWTVRFVQQWDGIPVVRGSVNVLLDTEGRLLSIDSSALPGLSQAAFTPDVDLGAASTAAAERFVELSGRAPLKVEPLGLVYAQELIAGRRLPALAWEFETFAAPESGPPVGWVIRVGATGSARILEESASVHHYDVSGTVFTLSSPGTKPDTPVNPEVPVPAAHMLIETLTAGSVVTDEFGNFSFPGVDAPLLARFSYTGPFSNVNSWIGNEYSLTLELQPGVANTVTMNPLGAPTITTQSNAFVTANRLRDWIRSVNPDDDTADFVNEAMVNFDLASCNGSYDGTQTTFYVGSGSCVDSAYSSIIAHESGHWLNDRYGSGNGITGFGEGCADVYGMYMFDSPLHAEDYYCAGAGCEVRSGENTVQFCGDQNLGCHGGLHSDGEVLMGALWKVRASLNGTLGNEAGDLTADLLFNGWLNAYDDGEITTLIRTHWLTLDDDDGLLANGTPHYAEIEAGFAAQGFPPFPLSDVLFTDVSELPDTPDQVGPYGVQATIQPMTGSSIVSADLHYSVNGGTLTSVPMSPGSGNTWTAELPGQLAPARTSWYLEATDDLGNQSTYPFAAEPEQFHVGLFEPLFFDDFEGPDDGSWTHAAALGADDWERGTPNGATGTTFWGGDWSDPPSAASGVNVWGTDLGTAGDGQYPNDSTYWLRAPTIDCTDANFTRLRFKRWLTTDRSAWDKASVIAAGEAVWLNVPYTETLDTAWQAVDLDIGSQADGNPALVLEWQIESNVKQALGGWNLDDVGVYRLVAPPAACLPTSFGSGLPGTLGVPVVDTGGQPTQVGNADWELALRQALPDSDAWIVLGFQTILVPLFGGALQVTPDVVVPTQTGAFGQAQVPFPLPDHPSLAGVSLYLQGFVLDFGAPQLLAISAPAQVGICP